MRNITMAALLACGVSASASAGPITFTFDTTSTPSCTALSGGAGPSTIQSYMNCVLGGAYVTSVSSGAVAQNGAAPGTSGTGIGGNGNGYTADGRVVGSGTGTQSLTLGNTNGATLSGATGYAGGTPVVAGAADTFIMTNMSASQFDFQFGNGFTIAAGSVIKFDYQIFPNSSCVDDTAASCGGTGLPNLPDFKFRINDVQAGSTMWGVAPGTGGTYLRSPGMPGGETAPQRMGVFQYTVTSALLNPKLSFVDWPATIGIDNLTLTTPDQSVPEPLTLSLLGLGMVGLRTYRRRVVA